MPTAQYDLTAPLASSQVDAENGVIRDVALISVGEASGHGQRIDRKTLEMFYALVKGKTVKAFLNHTDNPKPTEAVGIYSGFYLDLDAEGVLRASQFQAFRAFRENNKAEFDTLFEMAADAPEAFGISANFFHDLEEATDGGNPYSRPTHVESFDIVCTPAANKALFSKKDVDDPAKEEQQPIKEIETQSQQASQFNFLTMTKAVFAHFAANSKALPHIAKFAAEADEKATDADIISKVELALSEDEQAALVKERDDLLSENSRLKGEIEALKPKADKEAELSKKVTDLEATVAKFEKASRGRYQGAAPVNTGRQDEPKKITTKAEFDAMTPTQKSEFSVNGGRITE